MKPHLALTLLLCSCRSGPNAPEIVLSIFTVIVLIVFGCAWHSSWKFREGVRRNQEIQALALNQNWIDMNTKLQNEEAEFSRRSAIAVKYRNLSNRRRYSRSTLTNTRF